VAAGDPGGGLVPVERAELVTRDVDLLAEQLRQAYYDHTARFRCLDPARVDAVLRTATAGPLSAGVVGCYGFEYAGEQEMAGPLTAALVTDGNLFIAAGGDELRVTAGDVIMVPHAAPSTVAMGDAGSMTLALPMVTAGSLAEAVTGVPAADLRFAAMAPVSAERRAMFARTVELICGQLVTCGATVISPLVLPELTRLAAIAFLATFPNTTMTAPYLPGPGWVAPAAVRRAAEFIEAHAGQPVTLEDIAAAAGVTGRAVQYGFRRYYSTTPTGYLRRIRLERAYADLAAAGPDSGLTVQAVARRWGWASPSQFTVAYQRRFGVPPSRTLRT